MVHRGRARQARPLVRRAVPRVPWQGLGDAVVDYAQLASFYGFTSHPRDFFNVMKCQLGHSSVDSTINYFRSLPPPDGFEDTYSNAAEFHLDWQSWFQQQPVEHRYAALSLDASDDEDIDAIVAEWDEHEGRLLPQMVAYLMVTNRKLQHEVVALRRKADALEAGWRAQPQSSVYFLRDASRPAIKIGRSTNVEKRIRQLESQVGRRLQLLATVPGGSAQEAKLHRRFADARLEGEWFSEVDELTDFIQSTLRALEVVA